MSFTRIIRNIFKPDIVYQFNNISATTISMTTFSIYSTYVLFTQSSKNNYKENKINNYQKNDRV